MKKIIVYAVILSILLTGCWDVIDPEKLGLVTLMGIDSSDGQIKVVIHEMTQQKISSDSGMGTDGGGSQIKLHESTAPTISEAIDKISASNFRRTYFGHLSAVIVSEELASTVGLDTIIDYFERNPEIRHTMWILIAKKGQFNRIFNISTNIEPGVDTGKIITGLIRNRPTLFSITNTLNDFLTLFWETGSEPYTSGIHLIEIPADKENQDGGTKTGEMNKYDLLIESTAVFKKDKLIGWLDNEESMGLQWAEGRAKEGELIVKFNNRDVALMVVRSSSSIKPSITDGKMMIDIHVNVMSDVTESQINVDYELEETVNRLQELQAEEIKKQILAAFNKSKSLKSDVFGFGNYFFGKYPDYWKTAGANWYDHYGDIVVNIDVDSKVNHIGLNRKTRKGS